MVVRPPYSLGMKNPPEITFDTKEFLGRQFTAFSPARHRVVEGNWPWFLWLLKATGEQRLFVYEHAWSGNLTLAQWIYTPQETQVPLFKELQVLDKDPRCHWPFDMASWVLKKWLTGDRSSESKKAATRAHQAEQRRLAIAEEKGATVRYLKQRGFDDAAFALRTGMMPFSTGIP